MFRIGKLAKMTGKTVRTIHFYEEMDLLTPAGRTKGGFRQYDDSAVLRIRWIDRLQELGFSLGDIKSFLGSLQSRPNGAQAMEDLRAFYAMKLIETRAARARLVALERELVDSLGYLEGCQTCAADTPITGCSTCVAPDQHDGAPPPPLVAAVQGPS